MDNFVDEDFSEDINVELSDERCYIINDDISIVCSKDECYVESNDVYFDLTVDEDKCSFLNSIDINTKDIVLEILKVENR